MTPSWLVAHASYIDSSRTFATDQLTFNAGSITNAALLKISMISASVCEDSIPLTVEITVANDVSIGQGTDSDIKYGVSDGFRFIGFEAPDQLNYKSWSPCFRIGGVSNSDSTFTETQRGPPFTPTISDSFYPGQFVFTIKLDESWGSCYTAHDGGLVKTAGYSNQLMLGKGLTLEVYKSEIKETVGIKYIKVAIKRDA